MYKRPQNLERIEEQGKGAEHIIRKNICTEEGAKHVYQGGTISRRVASHLESLDTTFLTGFQHELKHVSPAGQDCR